MNKARPVGAQVDRMRHRWPRFDLRRLGPGVIGWVGPLRGVQREYQVLVQWVPASGLPPTVFVLSPKLTSRPGVAFEDVPHLMFDKENPEDSGLCLYDPDAKEWDGIMLIADTILPWASEWLHNYEFWLFDGIWRGSNAPGPVSYGAALRMQKGLLDGAEEQRP